MFPTGDFDRLKYEVMQWYNDDAPITFGILIADYEQTLAREYIINYMNVFDKKSNNYIDFFIPGYLTYGNGIITLMKNKNGESYCFDRTTFETFVEQFEKYFGFTYEFSPVLVLVELKNKNFIDSQKIIIDLDCDESDIKRAGVMFLDIFDIAKRYVRIEDFSRELTATYIKGSYADTIVNAIGNNILTEINEQRKNVRRFRVQ